MRAPDDTLRTRPARASPWLCGTGLLSAEAVAKTPEGLIVSVLKVGSKSPKIIAQPRRALLCLDALGAFYGRHSGCRPGFRRGLCATPSAQRRCGRSTRGQRRRYQKQVSFGARASPVLALRSGSVAPALPVFPGSGRRRPAAGMGNRGRPRRDAPSATTTVQRVLLIGWMPKEIECSGVTGGGGCATGRRLTYRGGRCRARRCEGHHVQR